MNPLEAKYLKKLIPFAILIVLLLLGCAGFFSVAFKGLAQRDYAFTVCNDYRFVRCGKSIRIIAAPDHHVIIDRDVEALAWDDQFIFCRRRGPRIPPDATSPQGPDFVDWWVIDTKHSEVLGPFDSQIDFVHAVERVANKSEVRLIPSAQYTRDGEIRP